MIPPPTYRGPQRSDSMCQKIKIRGKIGGLTPSALSFITFFVSVDEHLYLNTKANLKPTMRYLE